MRLPPGGFGQLQGMDRELTRFKLCAVEGPAERLPVAHTCIYQLDLPRSYGSAAELRAKLLLAMQSGRGSFGLA